MKIQYFCCETSFHGGFFLYNKSMNDKLTPNYYKSKSGRDVIDWCEDFGLMNDAYVFNVLKYVVRAGKKPDNSKIRDLKKALSYIARYISYLQNESNDPSDLEPKQES